MPKQASSSAFKVLAVKRIKDRQSLSKVYKKLGLSDQTLRNRVNGAAEGKLNGAGGVVMRLGEMELSWLRGENLRLKPA